MERLLKGSGIDGVPFTEQHDAFARVVGEAARAQFRHQQIDEQVIGGDRPNEKRHLLHRRNALSCIAPALQRAANATQPSPERFRYAIFLVAWPGRRTGRQPRFLAQLFGRCRRLGADQTQVGERLPISLEVPPRPRRLEVFGFLLQVAQVVVQGGDERVGPIGTENAQSHAVTTRAHVREQHGERAQPAPADGRVVDPQYGDVPALVARAARTRRQCLVRPGRSWRSRAS